MSDGDQEGLEPDVGAYNLVLGAYGQKGDLASAAALFDRTL